MAKVGEKEEKESSIPSPRAAFEMLWMNLQNRVWNAVFHEGVVTKLVDCPIFGLPAFDPLAGLCLIWGYVFRMVNLDHTWGWLGSRLG